MPPRSPEQVRGVAYHPLHYPYLTTPLTATILVLVNATPQRYLP